MSLDKISSSTIDLENVGLDQPAPSAVTLKRDYGDQDITDLEMALPKNNKERENDDPGLPRRFLYLIVFSLSIIVVTIVALAIVLTSDAIDMSNSVKLIIGICNSLIGTFMSAAGICCQKEAHNRSHYTKKPATKHAIYWIGLLMMALGQVTGVVNMGLLGQMVRAPFSGLTLIYNALLARVMLKETYTRYDFFSTLFIAAGVCVAVIGAAMSDIQSPEYSLDKLLQLYFLDSWVTWFYSIVTIGGMVFSNIHVQRREKQSTAFGLFVFSSSAGIMAGFTGLAVKSTVEVIKGAISNNTGDFARVGTYLFILTVPCTIVPQLRYMNEGLKYFGTLKFVPLYQCFLILANMFSGMVYFREMTEYTTTSKAMFFSGCAITLIGVWVLLAKVEEGDHSEKGGEDDGTAAADDDDNSDATSDDTSLASDKEIFKKLL